GELSLGQRRWDDLEAAARGLEAARPGTEEAAVLRARGHLARQEFDAARGLLDGAGERAPQALHPRLVRAYAYLQGGRAGEAAERALRDVLAVDPGHAETRRNPALLLRRLGKPVDEIPEGA